MSSGMFGDTLSAANASSPIGQVGGKIQKWTDPLAMIPGFGDKWVDWTSKDIPKATNQVLQPVVKPFAEIDKTINPARRIPFVDKVSSVAEAKPGDAIGMAIGSYFAAPALAGAMGGAAGGSGAAAGGAGAGSGGSWLSGLLPSAGGANSLTGAGLGTGGAGSGLMSGTAGAGYGGGISSSILPGIMPGATVPSTVGGGAGGIFGGASTGGLSAMDALKMADSGGAQQDETGMRAPPAAAAYRGTGQPPNFMPSSAIQAPIGSGPAAALLQMILQQANTPKF